MGKVKVFFCLLLILFFNGSCYKEIIIYEAEPDAELRLSPLLRLDGKYVFTDAVLNCMRFPVALDSTGVFAAFTSYNETSTVRFEGRVLQNNTVNHFGKVEYGKSYPLQVEYKGETKEYELIFTNLPVIQIITDTKIWDEPKSLARIVIEEPDSEDFISSYAGVEYRGQSSRYLDKKSIGLSLWQGMSASTEFSESLLGFGSNCDWILNGAAIDPSGIRNLVSMEIWRDMGNEKDVSPSHHIGVKLRLAELFINNSLKGFYVFSEHVNGEFLDTGQGDVLYKGVDWAGGATKFECFDPKIPRSCFWNGWEQIVPDCGTFLHWEPLEDLYKIVRSPDEADFKENIDSFVDVNNFIDYYLFLNLVFAGDNTGKNMFLYRNVDYGRFQIIPWDLDGSWGISWDGTPVSYEGVLTNALYQRLFDANPDDFRLKVRSRWLELRASLFEEKHLKNRFDLHFRTLDVSGIFKADNSVWGRNISIKQQQAYMETWLRGRLNYLDGYYSNME